MWKLRREIRFLFVFAFALRLGQESASFAHAGDDPTPDLLIESVQALEDVCRHPESYLGKIVLIKSARARTEDIRLDMQESLFRMIIRYGFTNSKSDEFGVRYTPLPESMDRRISFVIDRKYGTKAKNALRIYAERRARFVTCDIFFHIREIESSVDPSQPEIVGELVWLNFEDSGFGTFDPKETRNVDKNLSTQVQRIKEIADRQNAVTARYDAFQSERTYTNYQNVQPRYYVQYYRPSDYNMNNPPAVRWQDPTYWQGWPVYRGPSPIFVP